MKFQKMSTQPIKMWIDGKSYAIQKLTNNNYKNIKTIINEVHLEYEITTAENGKFHSSFKVPEYYIKSLTTYNFKGVSLLQIQNETTAKVIIPIHNNSSEITILGSNKISVATARFVIHSIIGELRDRHTALQFISMPIKSNDIQNSFDKFKNEILDQNLSKNVDETIFMKTKKLHLTIVCFALLSECEKTEAAEALNECKSMIIEPVLKDIGPIKVTIAGVHCMGNNPQKESILYANVQMMDESKLHTLQSISNSIASHFYERGFARKHQENVKLHMTLLNTKYRKNINPNKKFKKWKDFIDARPILEKYKNHIFGEYEINCIDLCLMQSDENGLYKVISSIKF